MLGLSRDRYDGLAEVTLPMTQRRPMARPMLIGAGRFDEDAPQVGVPVFVMCPRRVRGPLECSLGTSGGRRAWNPLPPRLLTTRRRVPTRRT